MKQPITIYRRGENWKRMPKTRCFFAWTTGGRSVVVQYDEYKASYRLPLNEESWGVREIVAWADIPQLEAKP